jgi:hypothetical protein
MVWDFFEFGRAHVLGSFWAGHYVKPPFKRAAATTETPQRHGLLIPGSLSQPTPP